MISSCAGACRMDGETCSGCGRTLNEIAHWGTINDEERKLIFSRAFALGYGKERTSLHKTNNTGKKVG